MAKPRVYKTEAIVLKRTNLGEADKILVLYTPNLGKIRAVAKGVRRPKSKLGGHVETLTHSSIMLAKGRNLDIIIQSQAIDSYLPLRNDLWRTSCALYTAELIDRFTEEQMRNYPIYRLLLDTIGNIVEAGNIDLLLRYFEIQLLGYLGYKPQLQSCISCKKELEPQDNYFSASGGGVLCPSCKTTEPRVRPLSLNALKVMRLIQTSNYDNASKVRLNAGLSKELEIVLREYIRYILEREVKSAEFLDQLRRA
jgi:DNA repair protein RecO (recombination protein O)